jgi:hypothetical protein
MGNGDGMSFFSKDNLNKLKGQLNGALDKAAEQGKKLAEQAQDAASKVKDQYDDVAANPAAAATKLQIKAVNDKLQQARINWMSVYADEMLNGLSKKDADGSAKGGDVLNAIKDLLVQAQVRVKGVKAGQSLANKIIDFGQATGKSGEVKNVEDLYGALTSVAVHIKELSSDPAVQDALQKNGDAETFAVLVDGFDYQGRCNAVVKKCNYEELRSLSATDFAQSEGLFKKIDAETVEKSITKSVSALQNAALTLNDLSVEQDINARAALEDFSDALGSYNLTVTVSPHAQAYAKHYGAQLANGAVSAASKALEWYAKRQNTPN